jgi:chemotaxis family two-component system sensor kinase Cph1
MEALLRDILAYTQAIASESQEERPVSLDEVMHAVVSNLKQTIERAGATVTINPLPEVAAAEVHMLQLFQNLVGNAIKYVGKTPPQVHVSATRQEDAWLFSVRDNGIGIDPQYREQIFGLFRRLHRNDEYDGTGVGLAICQKIVERYGGRIWVESELGQGADFRFTLPDRIGPLAG